MLKAGGNLDAMARMSITRTPFHRTLPTINLSGETGAPGLAWTPHSTKIGNIIISSIQMLI